MTSETDIINESLRAVTAKKKVKPKCAPWSPVRRWRTKDFNLQRCVWCGRKRVETHRVHHTEEGRYLIGDCLACDGSQVTGVHPQ